MARLMGLLALLLGLGMTTYFSHKDRQGRLQPGSGTEVHSMEGGDPAPPTPRP